MTGLALAVRTLQDRACAALPYLATSRQHRDRRQGNGDLHAAECKGKPFVRPQFGAGLGRQPARRRLQLRRRALYLHPLPVFLVSFVDEAPRSPMPATTDTASVIDQEAIERCRDQDRPACNPDFAHLPFKGRPSSHRKPRRFRIGRVCRRFMCAHAGPGLPSRKVRA
jgi:hypothetical protein